MNSELHAQLFDDYRNYVFSFADADGKLLEMQQLKYEHSLRVAAIARETAESENWPADDILLADIVGLYHDIGRYQQYKEYRTFQDYRSVNHGEYGWQIITATNCLQALPPAEQEIIAIATRYHNAKDIPAGLTPRQQLYLQLDRDSDKIDIYEVLYENIQNKLYLKYPEILHGVDPEGPVSAIMLREAAARRPLSYAHAQSMSDFLLITVLWVYDLHFAASRKIIRKRRVIDRIGEIIKRSPEVDAVLAAAADYLNNA